EVGQTAIRDCERGRRGIAVHSAVRTQLLQNVVPHTFKSKAQFDLVSSSSDESIVAHLEGGPGVREAVEPAQSNCGGKTRHPDLRCCLRAGSNSESWVGSHCIAGNGRIDIPHHTVYGQTQRIDHLRT